MNREGAGFELRADPTALAPERLLVFEVRGAIGAFASAIQRVPGLELIDEEELATDESDKQPVAYLMVPDIRALRNLESLWRRWQNNQLITGETPWRDVFSLLRDLRPWGPTDRIQPFETNILGEEIFNRSDADLIKLEIELVFRADSQNAINGEQEVRTAVAQRGGRIISRTRIDQIAYHALLVELPVPFVREIIELSPEGIAGLEPVMHIRPQSLATAIVILDVDRMDTMSNVGELGSPILALIDGVPVASHPLLRRHLIVDDQFGLESTTPVSGRHHGTAMASLIIHGDRNQAAPALPRRIHVAPVLGASDKFPEDRLIVDMIYTAIIAMRDGPEPTAPGVIIVSLSLGNSRRPFHGQISAWARLLDHLSYRFGLLFLVSAGNSTDTFAVPAFPTRIAFEDASPETRAKATLSALGNIVADRRLFSPAETVNGITVGACNSDAVPASDKGGASTNIDPYGAISMANPSSALGPGFALSVKPDILLPGAREHLRARRWLFAKQR